MIPVVGTVRNSVKLATFESKWQQKKQDLKEGKGLKKGNSIMTEQEQLLEQLKEQAADIREGKREADIDAKLKSGAVLTAQEIEYLRQHNPQALEDYEKTQQERSNYKKQLQNCKSKDDVETVKMTKLGEFLSTAKEISSNANIPKSEKLGLLQKIVKEVAAIEQEHIKFTQSLQYAMLPEESDEDEKKKASDQEIVLNEEAKEGEPLQEELQANTEDDKLQIKTGKSQNPKEPMESSESPEGANQAESVKTQILHLVALQASQDVGSEIDIAL